MNIKCAYTDEVELHKLQPHPKNPNKHPDRQIELLSKVIDYQGMRSPLVVSKRSGFLIKGHGRLLALQKLGWEKAPVDYQEYENEAQEYADLVADNKISELSTLDSDLMKDLLSDFELEDPELLAFSVFEMDNLLSDGDSTDVNSEWDGMPEFTQEDKMGYRSIIVHTHDKDAFEKFKQIIGQPITEKTKYVWYPEKIIESVVNKRYGES